MRTDSNDGVPSQDVLDPRTDPVRDRRRLAWYFGGLLVIYLGALIAFWPRGDGDPNPAVFFVVMFAPMIGALLARYLGPGIIQWGRPSWWILAALVPVVTVLGASLIGVGFDWHTLESGLLRSALLGAGVSVLMASVPALGEEVGWRGFLWPILRSRHSYLRASLVIGVVWWIYHVPFIFLGWYGSIGGLPAFTISLAGFTLFVGALTDRSKSVWPSVAAHGAWNALVATSFAVRVEGIEVSAFTGNDGLLGEFGWIPAVAMLILGVGTAWWHVRHFGVR